MAELRMKCFILEPSGSSKRAEASRQAILAYADSIQTEDLQLAIELREWIQYELDALQEEQTSG